MGDARMTDIAGPGLLFARYVRENAVNVVNISKDFGEDDIRFVFLVDTDLDEHVAVKVVSNSFTTRERILGWKELIDLYNNCGVYAPRIIPDLHGGIAGTHREKDREFTVYAEEMKKYRTAKEYGLSGREELFFEDMVAACAKMARVSVKLPPWKTAWCIYDTFCPEDEADETYEWARHFCAAMDARMPRFEARTRRIWNRFLALYEGLRPAYERLPKTFLQGDEGGDNALVDENGRFVGMLDFNLAGAETVLNYMFRNFCRVRIPQDAISRLGDAALRRAMDEEMRRRLGVVRKYYRFSDAERAVFSAYYQTVYPLECDLCQSFIKAIERGDADHVRLILDWIDFQQTRDDIDRAICGKAE
jgi:hypothetical protein